jgi:8-oxo-dGTP pyrophosphatase MutT (NUDIX family)
MSETDPRRVAIRHAATVMLIDDRPDLQIYVMERHADIVFGGGMWVFPGGRVDEADAPEAFASYCLHRTDKQASAIMQMPSGGLTYYIAAIREAFEEAGILLARHRDTGELLDLTETDIKARFDAHRRDINDSNRNFIELIEEENLMLDLGSMHYIARWITPEGPPRRYDTRFFITRMPTAQTPLHDDYELVHSRWLTPVRILEKFDRGEMTLMSPTLRMVRSLAQFSHSDQVIEAAAANQPDERARVNDAGNLVLPDDPTYATANENIESGWVRLRPLEIEDRLAGLPSSTG